MKTRNTHEQAIRDVIVKEFQLHPSDLFTLASNEGIIFSDKNYIYKALVIFNDIEELSKVGLERTRINDPEDDRHSNYASFLNTHQLVYHEYFKLMALSESINEHHCERMIPFEVFLRKHYIILQSPYHELLDYEGGHEKELVSLLREFRTIRWLCTDLCPKNVKILTTCPEKLVCIDMGFFMVPYVQTLFETTCRRAYITLHFTKHPELNHYLRKSITDEKFSFLENTKEHHEEYRVFRQLVEDNR